MKKTILTTLTVFCLAVIGLAQEPKGTFTPGRKCICKYFHGFLFNFF